MGKFIDKVESMKTAVMSFIVGLALMTTLSLFQSVHAEITPPPYANMKGKRLSTIECLTVNLYHEARGESDMANIMVLDVVMNRVYSSKFPNTPCQVIFAHKAFSWTEDGKSDRIKDITQYRRLYHLVETFWYNKAAYLALSEGADHYHDISVHPAWSYSHSMTVVGRVGNLIFYKSNW